MRDRMGMSNHQMKKRLLEAEAKFKKVYMAKGPSIGHGGGPVQTRDMEAVAKIVKRCLDRLRK